MFNVITNIERVSMSQLSQDDFKCYYLAANKPVIITDIFKGTAPLAKWTPQYLVEKLGKKMVRVNTSPSTTFFLDAKNGGFFTPPVKMPFSDYIAKIQNTKQAEVLYMQQLSIIKELKELKSYFVLPKYIDSLPADYIDEIGLWVSPGGNTTPLHYDFDNNFFIQAFGSKKFLIYNPWEFFNLYPNSLFSKVPYTSKIDLYNVDLIKYPKFTKAKGIEIIIHSGEMLFLPICWWHQVYSIDLTVSINIWWRPLFKQYMVPGALHMLLHSWYHATKNFLSKVKRR